MLNCFILRTVPEKMLLVEGHREDGSDSLPLQFCRFCVCGCRSVYTKMVSPGKRVSAYPLFTLCFELFGSMTVGFASTTLLGASSYG